MINFEGTSIQSLSIHYIGVNTDNVGVKYSNGPVHVSTDHLHGLLLKYFLSSFKKPEFFNFRMPDEEMENNPIASIAKDIFEKPHSIHEHSRRIADHLYKNSNHPKINSGDLLVCYFDDMLIDDEVVSAIGIFKNEDKDYFLRLIEKGGDYKIDSDYGISVDKLQKGCLIMNTEQEEGYKICIIDKSAKFGEAQYWKSDFLSVQNRIDGYHMTRDTIEVTKTFIEEQLKTQAEVERADQVDILNKSQQYFKSLERFNEAEYENSLFEDDKTKLQFQNFKRQYEDHKNVELPDQFDISQPAVKSQSHIFKSVIKLDRNFHIYIHGDRTKVTRGVDEQGKKYYKLYYDVEN